jgi:hypothetical protein
VAGEHQILKFNTIKGEELPCLDWHALMDFASDHRRTTRVIEAGAINMAMVTRHAIGSSALNGRIAGLLTDSLAGWVTAATLRHLANSGAEVVGLALNEPVSSNFKSELDLLNSSGTKILEMSDQIEVNDYHTVLAGIIDSSLNIIDENKKLWAALNDHAIPILSVFPAIPEITKIEPLLYASATLFLGLPLIIPNSLKDILGRTYLCDISLDKRIDKTSEGKSLFYEQPVIQIYPNK